MLTLHTSGVQVKKLLSVITGRNGTVRRNAVPRVVVERYIPTAVTYCKTPHLLQSRRSQTVSPKPALLQTTKPPAVALTNATDRLPAEADWHPPELTPRSRDVVHRTIIPDEPAGRVFVHPAANRMSTIARTAHPCVAVTWQLTSRKTITSRSALSSAEAQRQKTSREHLNDRYTVIAGLAE